MSGESSTAAEQYASLTALKMAALAESNVTYEQLADIEREFEDVETEIIRQQYQMSKPIYEKRQALVSQINNFWPLVLEHAPPDIDEFIQPLDSNLLLSSLKSISVSRFELDADPAKGDPRSLAIRFEFAENEHFEDTVLEKKFWYRYGVGDFAGLVSEPVAIKWKDPKKDLTDGLLDLVKKVWDEDPEAYTVKLDDKGEEVRRHKDAKSLSASQKALHDKIEETGMGGVSFFAWFGYVGRRVSEEESRTEEKKMRDEIQKRKEGKAEPKKEDESKDKKDEDEEMGEDEEDDEDFDDFEIFPPGDDLAQAIAVELWPEALKFFTQAQEFEEFSDMDFESDDEDEDEGNDRPAKKVKA